MVKSCVRFTPFDRGRIVGKAEEGASAKKIRQTVRKKDGTRGTVRAINAICAKARADPEWKGRDSAAGGRPQELSPHEETTLKRLMREEVGVSRVTVAYCKKQLPSLRRVSKECVRLSLHLLGLGAVPAQCPPSARPVPATVPASVPAYFLHTLCNIPRLKEKHTCSTCFPSLHAFTQILAKNRRALRRALWRALWRALGGHWAGTGRQESGMN